MDPKDALTAIKKEATRCDPPAVAKGAAPTDVRKE